MAEGEKLTIRDILVFPIVLFGWLLLNLAWRSEAADHQRKIQKRAKQLGIAIRRYEAEFQYEVCHSKNDNVTINLENLRVAANWLRENVGQQGVIWDLKIHINDSKNNVFIFRDEKYAAAFKLAFT